MSNEMKLPDVGEDVDKATVLSIKVSKGDSISEDDVVCEIETDKATLEVPSTVSGKVTELKISEGDEVSPGDVLLVVDGDGEDSGSEKEESSEQKEEPEEEASTSDEESEESDEADEEKEKKSKQEKSKTEPQKEQAEEKKQKSGKGTKSDEASDKKAVENKREVEEKSGTPVPAAPSVRRFAREIGADITQVEGSGENGRITIDDVKEHAKQGSGGGKAKSKPSSTGDEAYGPTRREKMSGIRKTIARRMAEAWEQVPHVHHFDDASIAEIEASRKDYNKRLKEGQPSLSMTAILVQLVARLLRQYPGINASLDMTTEEIVNHDYVHIGIAVDTERGLLVPVIRDADRKCVREINEELTNLAKQAREGKLGPDAMHGGTFNISNLGGIGGTQFTPIVAPPTVAILGVSRAAKRLRLVEGQPEEEMILPLCLGYDHRAIDGAQAARFMADLTECLSNPAFGLLRL